MAPELMALAMEYDGSINKDISVSGSGPRGITISEIKELSNKIDSLLEGISYLTNLFERNLEEKSYVAIRERERRW
jgi:hypothetical protein